MKLIAIDMNIGHNMWYDRNAEWNLGEFAHKERDFVLFEREAWDRIVRELPALGVNTVIVDLAEGVKYDCAPEIAIRGSLEKSEVKEMLGEMRALGLTAIPKLDFSAAHDVWMGDYAKMPDTDAYRAFVKAIITEVCQLFDRPAYFHIGMADETIDYQQFYGLSIVRGERGFWRDAYAMFDACRAMGARPIIDGEYYYREPLVFQKMIPSDVVIAAPYHNSRYGNRIKDHEDEFGRDQRSEDQKRFEALCALPNDVILVGAGLPLRQNINELFYFAKNMANREILGVMSESGLPTIDLFDFALLNEAMRLGKGKEAFDTGEF